MSPPAPLATTEEMLAFDREHIWHPYSSVINPPPVFPVARANGTQIELEDGRTLIDAMASWWSVIHGYNHPRINQALHDQIDELAHVMFGGFTHRPATQLAAQLIEITPDPLNRVFFADSGSVSVEVAIKMAIQFWASRNQPAKQKLLTVRGGYHGDTFGAMAVCDPVNGMHGLFTSVLPQHIFADRPTIPFGASWSSDAIASIERNLREHCAELAAVIIEPIVQGAGGMWFYHPEYLRQIRTLCDAFGVLLVFDEIATGFGRTGKLFACEHAGVAPDIMCLGKALTGGYMSLAATLTSTDVATSISEGEPGVFMHGPTFMANPLACAAAIASIEVLLDSPWQNNIARIEAFLQKNLAPCAQLPAVDQIRVLGAIGVVELKSAVDMHRIPQAFVDRGVWVRPFGRLVYVMPPYTITDQALSHVTDAIIDVLTDPPLL